MLSKENLFFELLIQRNCQIHQNFEATVVIVLGSTLGGEFLFLKTQCAVVVSDQGSPLETSVRFRVLGLFFFIKTHTSHNLAKQTFQLFLGCGPLKQIA